MINRALRLTATAIFFGLFAGCATVPPVTAGDAAAVDLLRRSADAHGVSNLDHVAAIDVRFDGHWSPLVGRIQPKLVDDRFRGGSTERYLVHSAVVDQTHTGPDGVKVVRRSGDDVSVSYNGLRSTDKDTLDAAALVADGYRMFLFGPAFFLQRGGMAQRLGSSCVDGSACDDVLFRLRPGIGRTPEDRVILSIDRQTHLLRRLRMTVSGLESAQGAVADIFLRDPIRIDGVVVPTTFYEELKSPFDLSVHNWKLTEVRLERE